MSKVHKLCFYILRTLLQNAISYFPTETAYCTKNNQNIFPEANATKMIIIMQYTKINVRSEGTFC